MKGYEIVGYAFDGALYCIGCVPQAKDTKCENPKAHSDSNGACSENCHGYGPNVIFASDEMDESEICDSCRGELS